MFSDDSDFMKELRKRTVPVPDNRLTSFANYELYNSAANNLLINVCTAYFLVRAIPPPLVERGSITGAPGTHSRINRKLEKMTNLYLTRMLKNLS